MGEPLELGKLYYSKLPPSWYCRMVIYMNSVGFSWHGFFCQLGWVPWATIPPTSTTWKQLTNYTLRTSDISTLWVRLQQIFYATWTQVKYWYCSLVSKTCTRRSQGCAPTDICHLVSWSLPMKEALGTRACARTLAMANWTLKLMWLLVITDEETNELCEQWVIKTRATMWPYPMEAFLSARPNCVSLGYSTDSSITNYVSCQLLSGYIQGACLLLLRVT